VDLIEVSIFGCSFFLLIILFAFIAEFINAIFGGGHGTILTPLLIMLGFSPLAIVPSILLAEVVSGLLVSIAHHKIGNVDFGKNSNHLRIAGWLSILSIIGVILAVIVTLNMPVFIVETYIGLMIIGMGIVILLTINKSFKFSWRKLMMLGIFASFNKALSGGGYGPIITAGQILTGSESRHAVSISSLAKGLTNGIAVLTYLIIGEKTNWVLAPSLVAGAIISVPLTACTVKKMKEKMLRFFIGIFILVLCVITLIKIFM